MVAVIKNLWFGGGSFQTVNLLLLTISFIVVLVSFIFNNYYVRRTFLTLMFFIIVVLYARATVSRVRTKEFNVKTTAVDILVFSTAPLVGAITVILFVLDYFLYLPLYYLVGRSSKFILHKLAGDECPCNRTSASLAHRRQCFL